MNGGQYMKNKVVFILAILFGLTAAILTYTYLSNLKKTIDTTEYVEIVVAKQVIPEKTVITANMLEHRKIPSKYKHSNEVLELREVVGRISLVNFTVGQSIFNNQIVERGDYKEGLAYMIPDGKRAMSVPVDEVSGVSGLIRPGDKVDIISVISIDITDNQSKPHSLAVLQDIEVLAIGKALTIRTGENAQNPVDAKTVTLAVSLEESIQLQMANQRGTINLLLRSPIDDSKFYPKPFIAEDFLK